MATGAEAAGRSPGTGRRRRPRWARVLLVAAGVLVLVALGLGGAYVASAARGLPPLTAAGAVPAQTSYIYDLSGKLVEPVPGAANRVPIASLAAVPLDVQRAFIASQDPHFYQSGYGADIGALLGAVWAGLTLHRPAAGPLTIPQQLALDRLPVESAGAAGSRAQADLLALELIRHYTRDELLTMYLNQAAFGQGTFGLGAAAAAYFGVTPARLTLGQGALLAGLVGAPAAADPRAHPQAALQRRNAVLTRMRQQGYITATQAAAAEAQTMAQMHLTASPPAVAYPYPSYVQAVLAVLRQHFSDQQIYTGGLRIDTALNPAVQQDVEGAMGAVLDGAFPLGQSPSLQSAAVVMNQYNGDVEAIVGGRGQAAASGPDRATAVEAAPGTAIQPLAVYAPALESGMTAATVIDDAPMEWTVGTSPWIPTNADDAWEGLTTLREGLRRSVSEVAARVLAKIGVARGYQVARALGLSSLSAKDETLPLALGDTADCCTPLEMARAYATIANGGYRVSPLIVLKVTDAAGDLLYQATPSRTPVLSPQVAYVTTSLLESVVEPQPSGGWIQNVGSAPGAAVPGWPTAGQPGAPPGDTNGWFVGFTPELTAAIWGGYATPQVMNAQWGADYGASIFQAIMIAALRGQTPTDFARPDGIVTAPIDAKSGELPGSLTPTAWVRNEVFVQGTQPTATSGVWVQRQVDSANPKRLWNAICGAPPATHVFLNRTPVTAASVAGLAVRLGLPAARLIPADMTLAPPQKACGSGSPATASATATGTASATGSAPATGSATGPATASASSGTPGAPAPGTCVTPAGGHEQVCSIVLATGQPIQPSVIQGYVGEPLELYVSASGGPHRLVISALHIDVTLQPGQPVTLLRTLTQAGTFPVLDPLAPGGEGAVLVVQQHQGGG